MDVHGLGVLFRAVFNSDTDYYAAITSEHAFQTLMLDLKPSEAFRKGVYITRVDETPDGEAAYFRLLRCSTNLAGPTENLRATDVEIIGRLNGLRERSFPGSAELNHVLAQTYHNTVGPDGKQKKAKISSHSDKTKDMPSNAVMTFCTFYDSAAKEHGYTRTEDGGLLVGNVSALTRLRFRRKADADAESSGGHAGTAQDPPTVLDVVLYPNSAFMMPLSTNRLYTHEIVPPPSLSVDQIPTRLGYVVRSSATEALHTNGHTYLLRPQGQRSLLEPPNDEGVRLLRELYFYENTTARPIDYDTDHRFLFSLNSGDYLRPQA